MSSPSKAPAFNQGLKPKTIEEQLAGATPEQISALSADNFAVWSQFSGIEVDNHKFDFDQHRYLLPLYLDQSIELVLIKAAQMGATIYMLLYLLWFARHNSVKVGLYFPTGDGVSMLSKDRLSPLLRSSKELSQCVVDDMDTIGLKHIENIHGKVSSLYMLYLGGQASKDSVPLDAVCFDEVRLVKETDIDQALERISHSPHKLKRFMSTAGYPNEDIDKRFKQGSQFYWHVKCRCPDGFIPSDVFPDCIGVSGTDVYLRCPKCSTRIVDPQNGAYVAHNPKADFPSYHISQLISKFITPKEIWTIFNKTTNKREFYNAKLGRPYIDVENQPVTDDILESCVNTDISWALSVGGTKDLMKHCAMGVDQMGGFNYVVIMKRGADGKKQLVHLEIIEQHNPRYWENGAPVTPFKRLYQLMREFDVGVCVCDAMPNVNEAQDFARSFKGRVFLGWYGEAGVDMVKWYDKLKVREQIRKGSQELRLKWQVVMHRYQTLDYALQQFIDREMTMPHPDSYLQVVRSEETGRFEAEPIARRYWTHMKALVRQFTITNEETGKGKHEWIYIGGDPHFAHAHNYACIALERMKRTPQFVMV